ncbi:MAG TPA: beta-N-acetylhexosaminidase [Candidatus Lustribacter sp.]
MNDLLALASGVIVTGFDGLTLDAPTRETLARVPFAGYILFARNLHDVAAARALTDELRSLSALAPIVAVDQEGGRIARLRNGVEVLPSMMALGATGDAALAHDAGVQLGHDLRRAGFNLDFAPVLDLAIDPGNTVIGTRAFGSSPAAAAKLGAAFARGLERSGIVATFKHFPGHGATSHDTHVGPARLDVDRKTLFARDLAPFFACSSDARAIMAAHVAVPAIDGDVPASLSSRLLTGVLRDQWGFQGVCVTDCMQMDAIAQGVGTIAGVTLAIAAGADCALVSHDPVLAREAARHLAQAVERGDVPLERLQTAHARVVRLRSTLASPIDAHAAAPHAGIGRRIAARAVTVVRGSLVADRAHCLAVVFGDAAGDVMGVRAVAVALDPDDDQRAAMLDAVRVANRRPVVLMYRAHLHAGQRRAIDAIVEMFPAAIVVSTGEPFDLSRADAAQTLAASYGNDEAALGGLADVLFEHAPAAGRLPAGP